jgi:hypothetical protein
MASQYDPKNPPFNLLEQASDYLSRAEECFEEAAALDEVADILMLVRVGQAYYQAAEKVCRSVECRLRARGER